MKHENRYQVICEMLQAYDNATGNRGADHVIKNPHEWLNCQWQPFYANAAALIIEAREAMNTKTTGAGYLAALKRIVKNVPDHMRNSMGGIFETIDAAGTTKYTLCDGHRILRLDQDVTSLPHVEKEKAFSSDSINKMMNDSKLNKTGEALNLPTAAEIKAFMAEQKAKHGNKNNIPICIDGYIYVNPQYLLDFVQALPDCKAYKPENNRSPIYFAADNGDGILLPVNPAVYQTTKAA